MLPYVIVLASTAYNGHQLYDQRLARALTTYAHVVYVNPPQVIGRRQSPPAGSSSDDPRLHLITPRMVPYGRRRFLHGFTAILTGVQIRRQLRSFCREPRTLHFVVIAASAATLRVLPKGPNVHIVKDDYVAGSELIGIAPSLLLKRFYAKMRLAQHVTAVSPFLQQVLLARGVRSVVVPAGCTIDTGIYDRPDELDQVPTPRAAFIGMISDRIDFLLVGAIVDAGVSVVFVGPLQNTFTKHDELAVLKTRDNFVHLSPRTGSALEAVLQHCQVGLIPYIQSDFNNASFPLKAFEYLASGLPIVSTPLPAMSWLDHDEIQVRSAKDEFVSAVVRAADSGDDVASRCRDIARANSWDGRAAAFASMLGLVS